jgi:hypothetical protein
MKNNNLQKENLLKIHQKIVNFMKKISFNLLEKINLPNQFKRKMEFKMVL